jgi:hypothetical protein
MVLAVYKKCDRLQAYIAEGRVDAQDAIEKIESIATKVDDINKEAEQFPTSKGDYSKAKNRLWHSMDGLANRRFIFVYAVAARLRGLFRLAVSSVLFSSGRVFHSSAALWLQ